MPKWQFWVKEMDDEVGKIGTVESEPYTHGGVTVDIGDGRTGFCYPPEVLDLIEDP